MKLFTYLLLSLLYPSNRTFATTNPEEVIQKLKSKLEKVNDYIAEAKMRTNVLFIKAPVGSVNVYYKKPNKIKITKEKGINILPKGGVIYNATTLLSITNYDAIDAGEVEINKIRNRLIRILPKDANSEIILMDIYVDEQNLLITKSSITSKENGSIEMEMMYDTYKEWMLPNKLILSFKVKDYKIPKSISLDFDESQKEKKEKFNLPKKGRIELTYTKYDINKGVDDKIFK